MKTIRNLLIATTAASAVILAAWMSGCVTVPVGPGGGGMQFNTNRPGADINGSLLPLGAGPAACRHRCNTHAACRAWTYVKPGIQHPTRPKCWIKHHVPLAQADNCCTSGVK